MNPVERDRMESEMHQAAHEWAEREWADLLALDVPNGHEPTRKQEAILKDWIYSEKDMIGRGGGKSWLREVMRRRIERLEGPA